MDKQIEDKLVKQIEKNLSDKINTELLYTDRNYRGNNQTKYSFDITETSNLPVEAATGTDNPILSFEYSNPTSLSRAEYIRQAREACLRQLSELQATARAYDSYYLDSSIKHAEVLPHNNSSKNVESDHIPVNYLQEDTAYQEAQENKKDLVAFRFLIIRMVCAIVIFLSVFLIDKFHIKIGGFASENIKEYLTGNDTFDSLENMIVTLLKK
jgi:hypothetical protein